MGFQGIGKSRISMWATKVPSERALLQGQEKPPTSLAESPSSWRRRIAESSGPAERNIRKSKDSSFAFQTWLAVLRVPSVLSIQLTNASDPEQRNCASS